MTKTVSLPQSVCPVQTAWELSRIGSCTYDTVTTTMSPTVLSAAYATLDDSDASLALEVVSRSICPDDVLTDVLAGRFHAHVALHAAAHPRCREEEALAAFEQHARDFFYAPWTVPSLMHTPRSVLRFLADSEPRFRYPSAQLADEITTANRGFLSDHVSTPVRRWFDDRDAASVRGLRGQVTLLTGRDDLTFREVGALWQELSGSLLCLSWQARRAFSELSLSFAAASALLSFAAGTMTKGAFFVPELLDALLAGRDPSQRRQLLGQFVQSPLYDERRFRDFQLSSLWGRELVDVARAAGRWPSAAENTLDMLMPHVLLSVAAPQELFDLNDEQLSVFEQMAAGWQGTFRSLLAVIDRM